MPRFYQPGRISELLSRQGQSRAQEASRSTAADMLGATTGAFGQIYGMMQRQPYYDRQRMEAQRMKKVLSEDDLRTGLLDEFDGDYSSAIKAAKTRGFGSVGTTLGRELRTQRNNELTIELNEAQTAALDTREAAKLLDMVGSIRGPAPTETHRFPPGSIEYEGKRRNMMPDAYQEQRGLKDADDPLAWSVTGGQFRGLPDAAVERPRMLAAADAINEDGKKNQAWGRVANTVRDLVPDAMKDFVPDQYDPAAIDVLRTGITSTRDRLEDYRLGLEKIRLSNQADLTKDRRQSNLLAGTGALLAATTDQASWEQTKDRLLNNVGDSREEIAEILGFFPAEWSPANAEAAATIGGVRRAGTGGQKEWDSIENQANLMALAIHNIPLLELSPRQQVEIKDQLDQLAQEGRGTSGSGGRRGSAITASRKSELLENQHEAYGEMSNWESGSGAINMTFSADQLRLLPDSVLMSLGVNLATQGAGGDVMPEMADGGDQTGFSEDPQGLGAITDVPMTSRMIRDLDNYISQEYEQLEGLIDDVSSGYGALSQSAIREDPGLLGTPISPDLMDDALGVNPLSNYLYGSNFQDVDPADTAADLDMRGDFTLDGMLEEAEGRLGRLDEMRGMGRDREEQQLEQWRFQQLQPDEQVLLSDLSSEPEVLNEVRALIARQINFDRSERGEEDGYELTGSDVERRDAMEWILNNLDGVMSLGSTQRALEQYAESARSGRRRSRLDIIEDLRRLTNRP